jgi:hypothetical protein
MRIEYACASSLRFTRKKEVVDTAGLATDSASWLGTTCKAVSGVGAGDGTGEGTGDGTGVGDGIGTTLGDEVVGSGVGESCVSVSSMVTNDNRRRRRLLASSSSHHTVHVTAPVGGSKLVLSTKPTT